MKMPKSLLIMLSKECSFEETGLALSLAARSRDEGTDTTLFLIEDGVLIARKGQKLVETAKADIDVDKLVDKGVKILAEDLSLKARGISEGITAKNVKVSSLDELVDLIMEKSDRVVWF